MNDKIFGAGLFGIDAFAAEVETYISEGLPKFDIVGLPDSAVRESRDRVRAAADQLRIFLPALPHNRQSRSRRHKKVGSALRFADTFVGSCKKRSA